jgi:hypothetical protein
MVIHLSRNGEILVASVLYNFHQVSNTIVLKFHKTSSNDIEDLILMYDPLDKKWKEAGNLEKLEPDFFQQVLSRLSMVLREAEKYFK